MLDQMAFPPRAPPVIASEEQRPSEGTIRAPLDTSSDGSKRQVGRTTPLRRHNQGAVGHKQRRQQATGRKNNAPPKAQSDLRQATVALLEMVGRTTPLRRHNQRSIEDPSNISYLVVTPRAPRAPPLRLPSAYDTADAESPAVSPGSPSRAAPVPSSPPNRSRDA